MRKQSFEFSKLAILASLVFLIAGCGQADPLGAIASPVAPAPVNPGAPPPGGLTACPAGQVRIGDGACIVGDFRTACQHWMNVGVLTTVEGREVCKVTGTHFPLVGGGGYLLPIVTPSNAAGSYYATTFVKVRKNDKITIDDVKGAWGGPEVEKWLDTKYFDIDYFDWNDSCDQITVEGKKGTEQIMNEDKTAGLFGSDGAASFYVGKGVTDQVMTAHGNLRLGFNAPSFTNSCGNATVRVRITHCEDAGGNSYLCP